MTNKDLEDAPALDLSRRLVGAQATSLIKYIDKATGIGGHTKKRHANIEAFLVNMIRQNRADPDGWLRYSRSTSGGHWSKNNRVGANKNFRHLIDALEKMGLVTTKSGVYNRTTQVGRSARFKATKKLWEFLKGFDLDALRFDDDMPLVELKDANKEPIDHKDMTPEQQNSFRVIEHQVAHYNAFMSQHTVTLPQDVIKKLKLGTIHQDETKVKRVFNNGSFNFGGRFYGAWWHTVDRDARPYILIDAEPTVELDIKAQHPQLLYALEGQPLDTSKPDPYELPGYHRTTVKTAINSALNSTEEDAAWMGAKKKFQKTNDPVKKAKNQKYVDEISHKPKFRALIDAFKAKHPVIAKYLYSGIGLKLQNIDSYLCNWVHFEMVQLGKPVVSIHDSFICKKSDVEALKKTIRYVYAGFKDTKGTVPTLTTKTK